jgi:hypothetical protein
MPRPRITIAKLVLVVLVAAIVLAALHGASALWAGMVFSVMFFVLFSALLGIVFGRGLRRIYWSGFALLGWGYLLVFHLPGWQATFGEYLLVPNLCLYLDEALQTPAELVVATVTPVSPAPPSPASPPIGGDPSQGNGFPGTAPIGMVPGLGFPPTPAPVPASVPILGPFPSERVRIGMAMEALLWAFVGGWVARYFASGTDDARASAIAATATPVCETGSPPEPET